LSLNKGDKESLGHHREEMTSHLNNDQGTSVSFKFNTHIPCDYGSIQVNSDRPCANFFAAFKRAK